MGHAGTLDPDATGVLVVVVGKATRLVRYIGAHDKSYTGEVVLGTSTSTLDSSGELTGSWDMSGISLPEVRVAAQGLIGEIRQVPPMVSALKVGGRRLHELARAGIEIEREARSVTVHSFEVVDEVSPGIFSIEVTCSPGTYIRTLAADLGVALGGGAHLRSLRRTAIGEYLVSDAVGLAEVESNGRELLLPIETAVRGLSRLQLDAEGARDIRHGKRLTADSLRLKGASPWATFGPDDELVAVCRLEEGMIHSEVVLSV